MNLRGRIWKAFTEFSETCLSNERREAFIAKFNAVIKEQLGGILENTEQLSPEAVKEFLMKRFRETGQRSVTIDLIDEIRKEGFGERLEEKLRSVNTDLEEEESGNPDRRDAIKEFQSLITIDFEQEKSKLGDLDLADEDQLKAYNREQLEFFKDVDNRVNQFLSTAA